MIEFCIFDGSEMRNLAIQIEINSIVYSALCETKDFTLPGTGNRCQGIKTQIVDKVTNF